MTDTDTRPPRTSWFVDLLFWIGVLCLWAPLALLFMIKAGGGGFNAFYGAVGVLEVGVFVMPAGLVLLIVYAVLARPWRRPFAEVWLFWGQCAALAIALLLVASVLLDDWSASRRQASTFESFERAAKHAKLIREALPTDDADIVAREYPACEGQCAEWHLAFDAMAYHAVRSLDVIFRGMDRTAYENKEFYHETPARLCRGGVSYDNQQSLAGWAGSLGDRAIVERLMPLWAPEEKQAALYGAAFGNQPDIMAVMLEHGASLDPGKLDGIESRDPLVLAVEAATRSGSTEALAWLGTHAGRPVPSDTGAWVEMENWINATPSSIWQGRLEPMLDGLSGVGAAKESFALRSAVQRGDAVLARVLIRRGFTLDADDNVADDLKLLLAGPADAVGRDDGRNVKFCDRASSKLE
ncbi:hypothetical protein KCV01_g4516, partial [Aureobasidium melanogenum]